MGAEQGAQFDGALLGPKQGAQFDGALLGSFMLFAAIFIFSSVQFSRAFVHYRPWTAQKRVHLLAAAGSLLRAAFLFAARSWWDSGAGSVADSVTSWQHEAFYVLDELACLAFLLLYGVVLLFCARVCCVALDRPDIFTRRVWPATAALLSLVTSGHVVVWVLYGSVLGWRQDKRYARREYAVLSAASFLLLAVALLGFGCLLYQELRAVPVDLRVRMRRARELGAVTAAWTLCWTAHAALTLWVATARGQAQLGAPSAWVMVVVYFDMLEAVPLLVTLWFHRRVPRALRGVALLNGSASGGLLDEEAYKELPGGAGVPDEKEAAALGKGARPASRSGAPSPIQNA
eukprot:g3572.t1